MTNDEPPPTKRERIAAGLAACDVTRQAVRDNAAELDAVCAYLGEQTYPRTPVRLLDALLWLAYGGEIRPGRPGRCSGAEHRVEPHRQGTPAEIRTGTCSPGTETEHPGTIERPRRSQAAPEFRL
jgi:hypothetical protein